MKFSSNKVLDLPLIANADSVAANDPAVDTSINLATGCDGSPFTEIITGVLVDDGGLTFYTYDEFIAAVNAQELAATVNKHIGTALRCGGGFWVLLDMNIAEFIEALGICCGAEGIDSAPYALKASGLPLDVDKTYPCGYEAAFKWLAVFGTEDPALTLIRYFDIELQNAAVSVTLVDTLSSGALAATIQTVLNWPADFIGLTIDGITLVANNVVAGVNEMNIGDFDYGKITVRVRLEDLPDIELIDEHEWSLPDTTCGGESSSGESSGSFSSSDGGSESESGSSASDFMIFEDEFEDEFE